MKKVVLLHPLSGRTSRRIEGAESEKFFESLRPAQDQRRGDAPRGKEPFRRNTKENIKAEPEIQSKNIKKDNSTTKSLILAQDER